MRGEIPVRDIMDREARLQVWKSRQDRDAEWIALKQWWRAERRYRYAKTDVQRWRASLDRARTAWLYRAELGRAWPKWRQFRASRWDGAMLQEDAGQP
jgi:hypothetical protein